MLCQQVIDWDQLQFSNQRNQQEQQYNLEFDKTVFKNEENLDIFQDLQMYQNKQKQQSLDLIKQGFPYIQDEKEWKFIENQELENEEQKEKNIQDLYSFYLVYLSAIQNLSGLDSFKNLIQEQQLGELENILHKKGLNNQQQFLTQNKNVELEINQIKKDLQIIREVYNCLDCQICKVYANLVLQSFELILDFQLYKELPNKINYQIKDQELNKILHGFESVVQVLGQNYEMYNQRVKYWINVVKSTLTSSLACLLFLRFALEVKISLKDKVRKLFRNVFPKEMKAE
ncbi:hypothetical protein PPERSA_03149 [Pseudocohnilembus persalinus]|uniref:Uncharacterized protein n=1 Tax=Pseudocohnilembus persalinus TaxID=266149 RepID=A0A0V0QIT3_PSEPJ|nr:hypothetical protein PPERSA_03149 [Pseudocohnilembus persalinus]|eukprot:KRX02087.1 hypothetical protein PPERSA_03149 [Pseudocohnilembus persalinus]